MYAYGVGGRGGGRGGGFFSPRTAGLVCRAEDADGGRRESDTIEGSTVV